MSAAIDSALSSSTRVRRESEAPIYAGSAKGLAHSMLHGDFLDLIDDISNLRLDLGGPVEEKSPCQTLCNLLAYTLSTDG